MKTKRVTETIVRHYWTCARDHHHTTEERAVACLSRRRWDYGSETVLNAMRRFAVGETARVLGSENGVSAARMLGILKSGADKIVIHALKVTRALKIG